MNNYRHGDILLVPTEKTGVRKISKGQSHVLAYGEATGHRHLLTASPKDTAFSVFEDKKGTVTLILGQAGSLTHEEHKQLEVTPGTYKVVHEREYDYFALESRRVAD